MVYGNGLATRRDSGGTNVGMRVLIVGGGGREHAVAWKLARSQRVGAIVSAPGNPGMATLGRCASIATSDHEGLVRLAREERIDLVVVGPEEPLAAGLADRFTDAGFRVAGHTALATRIESSKVWANALMAEAGIPTSRARTVVDEASGHAAIADLLNADGVVIKADGLAAGKGVVVANDRAEAMAALNAMLTDRAFGDAGTTVVVEERLSGPEVSVLALTDGTALRILAPACDHKRAFDGDEGPNTGGMGVYTPTRLLDTAGLATVRSTILEPAVRAMRERDAPLRGVLYAGLMMTPDGPKVIEFNARFGDPETQVVLPTLTGDLGAWLGAVADGTLADTPEPAASGTAVGVALASGGYPGAYAKGLPISGLDEVATDPDVIVFHAGTADRDGGIVTAGGRALTVVGLGPDLRAARDRAYAAAERITFDGRWFRTDIATRELP